MWLVDMVGGDESAAANMAWLTAERGISLACNFLLLLAVARSVGTHDFGLYQFAYSLVFLVFSLSQLGLRSIVVKELVMTGSNRDQILGTALWLRIAAVTAAFVVALPMAEWLKPGEPVVRDLVFWFSLAAWFQTADILDWWFESRVRSKFSAVARFGGFLLSATVKAALLISGSGIVAIAAATVIEFALAAILVLYFYARTERVLPPLRWDSHLAGRLLRSSFPLLLSGVAVALYQRVDQVMLGRMRGPEETGIYSSAVLLTEGLFYPTVLLAASYFPKIIRSHTDGPGALADTMSGLYRTCVRIGMLTALPLVAFSGVWMVWLFGADYAGGSRALPWLALAGIFMYLGTVRGRYLVAEGLTGFYMFSVVSGCVVNIALNAWWIPLHGPAGAAAATLISYWFAAHGSSFCYAKTRPDAHRMTRALFFLPARRP
jgi:PST family polysaccharide transporter